MKSDIGFPPLGKLAKFLFESTGLLAEKAAKEDGRFSDAERKRLQKVLDRLVAEEGNFSENFNNVLTIFSEQIQQIIPSTKIADAILYSVEDVYDQYRHLLKEEGTYFNQKESVKWALDTRFINRLILSPQKNYLRLNIQDEDWLTPDDAFWFLPTFTEDGVTWPLQKALEWTYLLADTSLTHFHYPDKTITEEVYPLNLNETNARNWRKGRHLPSWHGLNANLTQSFDAMEQCTSAHHRTLSAHQKSSVMTVACIARFSTYVCQEIEREYGQTFLKQLLQRYMSYTGYLAQDHAEVLAYVDSAMKKDCQNRLDRKHLRGALLSEVVPAYWKHKADVGIAFGNALEARRHQESRHGQPYTPEEQKEIIHNFGRFYGLSLIDSYSIQAQYPPLELFFDELIEAEKLRKTRDLEESAINAFEQRLQQKSLNYALGWYVSWLYSVMYYRQESFEKAHRHCKKAYQQVKYSGGNRHYPLVNLYIELCAKTKQKKAFRKAIAWAHYIGMRVRWVGNENPTEEELDVAYTFFQNGIYPQT
ncbi:hypothetical protein [Neptunomonas qingdaonensis]|uniref:Uncharacterized protein n=1 Tax=Neptunomonas qingdaonensis TaxID=1045558 RepID=A0A1I2QQ43_9GAMM|nr:hypothetical protein [Neptunomonas qingdaonensis]SFG30120.1 hypothetical protein SAMN05216175_10562 [Neptunomonas qingdaonensis]